MGLFGNSADKVLSKGVPTSGRLVAIKVESVSDGESHIRLDTYTVEMPGGERLVIRQRLAPDDVVRLGMGLELRMLGDDALIDWTATLAPAGIRASNETYKWKMVKDDRSDGIRDLTLDLDKKARKGMAVDVEILGISEKKILMGLTSTMEFTLLVNADDEPYETTIDMQRVPHYATHLAVVGARLPAIVEGRRLDKVAIDWATAAQRDPGVGKPPSPMVSTSSGSLFGGGPAESMMSTGSDVAAGAPATADGPLSHDVAPPIEGVTLEVYAEVDARLAKSKINPREWDTFAQTYGVPAGRWADVSKQWRKTWMRSVEMQRVVGAIQQRVFSEP